MAFLYLKSLHIIFVITWFAGLFYIVRLFIYHAEAETKPEAEKVILQNQFKIMERRLWYGITWPSAIITLILGGFLASYYWPLSSHPWLLIKIGLVIGLFAYHLSCGNIYKKLQRNECTISPTHLRVWNEVATMFLFAIVFLVVLRSLLDMTKGLIGLFGLGLIMMIAIQVYKKKRQA